MSDKIRVNTHALNNDANSVQKCIERMKKIKTIFQMLFLHWMECGMDQAVRHLKLLFRMI